MPAWVHKLKKDVKDHMKKKKKKKSNPKKGGY